MAGNRFAVHSTAIGLIILMIMMTLRRARARRGRGAWFRHIIYHDIISNDFIMIILRRARARRGREFRPQPALDHHVHRQRGVGHHVHSSTIMFTARPSCSQAARRRRCAGTQVCSRRRHDMPRSLRPDLSLSGRPPSSGPAF